MELARFNDHCPKCPEKTETPLFDQMVHLHGFPGYRLGQGVLEQHVKPIREVKVIEGTTVNAE